MKDEDALRLVVEGTVSETGVEFFRALVKNLAMAADTAGAWVTEYLPERKRLNLSGEEDHGPNDGGMMGDHRFRTLPYLPFNQINNSMNCRTQLVLRIAAYLTLTLIAPMFVSENRADETCSSPYLARIEGQEEFVYVWTLGVEGLGDGADKLVVVDVKPGSASYGKVIYSYSVEGRNEAHHGGFTDDRRQLWLCGLETSKFFIFDVYSQPARPRLVKTIDHFEKLTGGATGPHGVYALPGRVLTPCLSNAKNHGGRTALVEFSNEGDYIETHWLPTKGAAGIAGAEFADGYNYDARVLPRKNVLLTTSFTGWNNYTREFGDLVKDPEAMKQFGNSMVLWNFHTRQPKKVFRVPGAPLEIRWAWGERHNYAFTSTALNSRLWVCYEDEQGDWQAKDVAQIGPKGGVLPVDISLSADDKTLFVDCFADGKCRVFDVSNPQEPKPISEQQIGKQVNMVSQSWDGKRLYFTSSLLAHWDKKGGDNEQFLRAYAWDGKELTPKFSLDFTALQLGRPHHMLFGSSKLGQNRVAKAN